MERIVVLGGGESGVGAAILAKKEGFDIFLSDSGCLKEEYKAELLAREIAFEENGHTKDFVLNANEIIKSPGIPDSVPLLVKAAQRNIPIISEIEFAARYTNAKLICITGSNGKTTTTSLIYHILTTAKFNVGLGGNIGNSFARQVAEKEYDYYVLELSSFQLDNVYKFKADIAILLNITPDHLDRYKNTMQNYVNAKMHIIQNQTSKDALIYWTEDHFIANEIEKKKPKATLYGFAQDKKENLSAYLENNDIVIKTSKSEFRMEQDLLALTGTHNLYNTFASGITAKLLDISDEDLRQALNDFKGVEHRLEKVADVRGVHFINDSKATNVNSCWYALKSVKTKIVLIIGGKDKGNDYEEIEDLVKSKVHTLVLLGVDNSKLRQFFEGKVPNIIDTNNMEKAVSEAYESANDGDTVLLSPCCASFDLFRSYEDRGTQFKYWVRTL